MSLFGAPKTNASQNKKLLGYRVQSSIFGTVIPIIYGTARVSGNVIWSGDFKGTALPPGGGKGGSGGKGASVGGKGAGVGNNTTYSYTMAVALALCEGPIVRLLRIWQDKSILRLAKTSEKVTAAVYTPVSLVSSFSDLVIGTDVTTATSAANPFALTALNGTMVITGGNGFTAQTVAVLGVDGNGMATFSAPLGTAGGTNGSGTLTLANFVADTGVYYTAPTTVTANDFMGPGPVSITGVQQTPLKLVSGSPQPGEYTLSGATYTFNPSDLQYNIVINYVFAQPTSATTGQPLADLSLSLFTGPLGQAPWGYLSSKHADQALGYSEVAYVANSNVSLGISGTLPNQTFEITGFLPFGGGVLDAEVSAVITDMLTHPGHGLPEFAPYLGDMTELSTSCRANGLFVSMVMDSQRTASAWIDDLLKIANAEAVWSGGLLKFRSRYDTSNIGYGAIYHPSTDGVGGIHPIYDLSDQDFLELPVVIRPTVRDAFNTVHVEWTNRQNDYNLETIEEKDDWAISQYGVRAMPPLHLNGIASHAVAQTVANIVLKNSVYVRNQYEFVLGWQYCLLEPMDLVTIADPNLFGARGDLVNALNPGGWVRVPVRILSIEEDEEGRLKFAAEEFPWGTAASTLHPKQVTAGTAPGAFADPGSVNKPIFFDAPRELTADGAGYRILIALSGGQSWGGCQVWVSSDNLTYHQVDGSQQGNANMGVLAAAFPFKLDPDNTNTLSVDFTESADPSSPSIVSHSTDDADSGRSIMVVGHEVVGYAAATMTAFGKYDLAPVIRRGMYGTTVLGHAAGSPVALLDNRLFIFPYSEGDIHKSVWFKFPSFNQSGQMQQGLANAVAYRYFIHGGDVRPPFPWRPGQVATHAKFFSSLTISGNTVWSAQEPFTQDSIGGTLYVVSGPQAGAVIVSVANGVALCHVAPGPGGGARGTLVGSRAQSLHFGVAIVGGAAPITVSYSDLAIDAVDSTLGTSAGQPFGPGSAGATVTIFSGTGFILQTVTVVSVTGGIATFDQSLGVTGSTGGYATSVQAQPKASGVGLSPINSVNVAILGIPPINTFSTGVAAVEAPVISDNITTSGFGGAIPGNATYQYAVVAVDANGEVSDLSNWMPIVVPAGSDNNTVTLTMKWPANIVNAIVYAGIYRPRLDETVLTQQQVAVDVTQPTVLVPFFSDTQQGPPDAVFDHLGIEPQVEIHSGVWADAISSVGDYTLRTSIGGWGNNQWAGYTISVLGFQDTTKSIPVRDLWIVSNTDNELTVSERATWLSPGDIVTCRPVPSTFSATTIGDLNFANSYSPGGLLPNSENSAQIYLYAGTGKNQPLATVISHTSDTYTVDPPWVVVPDATTRFLVLYPQRLPEVKTQTMVSGGRYSGSGQAALYPVSSVAGSVLCVWVHSEADDDTQEDPDLTPFREIYVPPVGVVQSQQGGAISYE
ncbi:MAG: hypothetical protein NVS1B6_00610 [Steroidobacteraceae bacterium]